MKNLKRNVALLLVAASILAPCALAQGGGGGGSGGLMNYLESLPITSLTLEEEEYVLFMREEEKLARDVYLTLNQIWGMPIFANIAASEQEHMDAVRFLIRRYDMVDPVADDEPVGEFQAEEFIHLYEMLVLLGSTSIEHALFVGNYIEDLDIVDLDHALDISMAPDARAVFQNLQKGSRNHLRNFFWNLHARGVSYYPYFLEFQVFSLIVKTPMEFGVLDPDGVRI
jgi:hypothetical protein